MEEKKSLDRVISNRINELKVEKNATNSDIATAIGVGASYISDILRGKKRFNLIHLEKLCEFFKITPSELFSEHSPFPAGKTISNGSNLFKGGDMLSPEAKAAIEMFVLLEPKNRLQVIQLIVQLDGEELKRGSQNVPQKARQA